jgi:hypothetical protein
LLLDRWQPANAPTIADQPLGKMFGAWREWESARALAVGTIKHVRWLRRHEELEVWV